LGSGYYRAMLPFSPAERALIAPLTTPAKIQDFLDHLAINHEKRGETCMSPRRVLEERKAHCLEGALLAASILWNNGERPLLMELHSTDADDDHAVALYKRGGLWGAISKTNHATLRFRDPVYRTTRELALSYFHEYFVNATGEKVLRSYTRPFSLKQFGTTWITTSDDVWDIAYALQDRPQIPLVPKANEPHLRAADRLERRAGSIIEWPRRHPRT